ncbi:hypothetical protein [Candidatus Venteria ishoeyi]|uniref:Sensory rhodopsin transducer n=1 Tax=Candidatus Venteria ishoeyi TaxID=1899563 RepID=A0A1H6F9I8_9GAMM|nr:hypothetical protein [Candidatus Venteria ishoeyi]SEH06767.1 Anabaena sensory rhodopsin transducer [Candidatus Venteria ishoeyi]
MIKLIYTKIFYVAALFLLANSAFASPVILNMDTHPQDRGWVTSCYNTGSSSLDNGILKIDSDTCYSFRPQLETTEYSDTGWVVKTRMRIADSQILQYDELSSNNQTLVDANGNPFSNNTFIDPEDLVLAHIELSDDIRYAKLSFYADRVKLNGYYQEIKLDMSQFHEFRLVGDLTSIRLYVDGALAINWRDVVNYGNQERFYLNMRHLSFGINNNNYSSYINEISYPGVRSVTEWDSFEYDLSAPMTGDDIQDEGMYVQYMPEGYIGEGILEFVGVLNSSAQTAAGEYQVYYSDGSSQIFPVSFPPYQRSSLDIRGLGVKQDTRFASVLKTDRRTTATLIHYEQGKALGANFTTATNTRWGIAEGFASLHTEDYLNLFNPGDEMVEVEVKIHPEHRLRNDLVLRVHSKSRATLPVHEFFKEESLPFPYGITVKSTGPVVAALSRHDAGFGDGMLFMATPGMGETSGYVAEGLATKNNYEYFDVLNLNTFPINLELSIHYIDGISQTTKHYISGYNQWTGITLTDNNIVTRPDIAYAVEYQATAYYNHNLNAPVIANFIHAQAGRMEGVRFQQDSHRYWEFAEGFRSANQAAVQEHLAIFNPSNEAANGTITFYYDDGLNPTVVPFKVSSYGKASFALHKLTELRQAHSWGGISYGIHINSNVGVIAHFSHQDKNLGGGFALNGTGWD